MNHFRPHIIVFLFMFSCLAQLCGQKIEVLIVDGQNNHQNWPKITEMMKVYLEETDLFKVDIKRTTYTWKGEEFLEEYSQSIEVEMLEEPKADPDFKPDFDKYDLVVTNFGWKAAPWPSSIQEAFENYIRTGGGLIVIHAANNSFPEWQEYNEMIGLGGWGGRTEASGPYVYYNVEGDLIRDTSPGKAGSHGPQSEFEIIVRNDDHPITRGMPLKWMHAKDELYDRLRGPANQMEVLATAYSNPDNKGTGRHEPMLLALKYGEGRIFHTPMGHADYSLECVGFITCLQRGAEWVATGKVSLKIPTDFPKPDQISIRKF